MLEIITQHLFQSLTAEAKTSARLRKNYNFHQNLTDPSQRLLIAMEPDSYIQPHRHLQKDETMLIMAGRMGLVFFNEDGSIRATHILAPQTTNVGVNISTNTFHSVVSLESGTVFFESKQGPYQPLVSEEIAHWAPAENDPTAKNYHGYLRQLFGE